MSLNLNETLARTASPENTSVMLNKPQLVDLKNIIREVFKDVIQKKDGKAEPKNKSLLHLHLLNSKINYRITSERLEEDIQSVTTILDASQLEARPITLYRVEKSDTSSKTTSKGPRPIKVVMPTAVFRRKAVTGYHENYKKNQTNQRLRKLVIRRWLNKEQRDLMKSPELN
uniref:Uncharacterized protein n=1 Tax=Ditylenchus dipsaci TaxID=166011 RepID=A0A915D4Y9_9BILA